MTYFLARYLTCDEVPCYCHQKTALTTFFCNSVCVCVHGDALPSSQQGLCCSIGWSLFLGSQTQPRIPGHPVQDAAWYVLLSVSSSPRCQLSLLLLFHYQLSGQATFISRQERYAFQTIPVTYRCLKLSDTGLESAVSIEEEKGRKCIWMNKIDTYKIII